MKVVCPTCGASYERTLKQVNQAIKKRGAWRCSSCAAGHNKLSLVGQKFGRLSVLAMNPDRKHSKTTWDCQCECGNKVTVIGASLTKGNSKSCGCLKIESLTERATHGKTGTREYRIWQAMQARCDNAALPGYKNYGGRGIAVCERWRVFENFFADMGPCPEKFSIERVNRDGNYEPGNCIWANHTTQMRNTRRTRFLTLNGTTKCLKEWAQQIGIDQASLRERLDKWSLEKALTTPKGIK